jgi:hypothetical protein
VCSSCICIPNDCVNANCAPLPYVGRGCAGCQEMCAVFQTADKRLLRSMYLIAQTTSPPNLSNPKTRVHCYGCGSPRNLESKSLELIG